MARRRSETDAGSTVPVTAAAEGIWKRGERERCGECREATERRPAMRLRA